MGQLEKYGLYVLVLLAFLIIGVAIWGDPAKAGGSGTPGNPLNAPATQQPNKPKPQPEAGKGSQPAVTPRDLGKELQQAPKPEPKKNETAKIGDGGGNGDHQANPANPANPPKPEEVAADTKRPEHKVKTGESFERIARDVLGNALLSAEIAKLNPTIQPTRLRAGDTIVLPSKAEIGKWKAARAPKTATTPATADKDGKEARPATASAAKGTYTVTRGDTIEGIAKRLLGDPKRARDIQELNPEVTPTSMKIGTVLKLPAK